MNITTLTLPGISTDYLAEAGVRHVDAATANRLCGISQSGTLFPYRNFHGDLIQEEGEDFARIRLDDPRGHQKYHQRSGTSPHAFLPPSIWGENKNLNNPIIIVEGEKKALALAEAGFTAVGIGGFYNFKDKGGALVAELAELLQYAPGAYFVFLGDKDVVFNYQFSHAALAFAELVAPAPVWASCVPSDGPGKGVDDCREALGASFKSWVGANVIATGISIGPESSAGSIALELLRRQVPALSKLQGGERDEAARGLSKLAAGLNTFPLEQQNVLDIATQNLGQKISVFKRMVKDAREKLVRDLIAKDTNGDPANVVNLGEQPGIWTRRVLEIIGQNTYLYGGNLCDLDNGKFVAHDSASLVSLLDSPDCCSFVRPGRQGGILPTHLTEKDTRIVLGALRQHADVLQPVDTFAQVPVLAWSPNGPELITAYSRDHRILATAGTMELMYPSEAAAGLQDLVRDFDFATPGDAGRAIALLLTPALASGGFLDSGRTPFFMIRKNQKGAGAGTFVRMTAAIYGTRPCSVTPDDVKSAKEDVSKHLLEGAGLIYFDNIRGKVLTELPFFESLLTEPVFTCRAPYTHGTVDVSRKVFAGTSNGAVLSQDLTDRTVYITIRKRSDGYSYHPWPEGDLIDHVTANRLHYLACIYSLIHAWAEKERPAGAKLSGFRFPQWERAIAWIIENFFSPLPLIDADHKTDQQQMANPNFDLLRTIFRAALDQTTTGPLTATDLVRIAVRLGRLENDEKPALLEMGHILAKEFPQEGGFDFANEFRVVRRDVKSRESNYEKLKTYLIMPTAGNRKPVFAVSPTGPVYSRSAYPSTPPPTPVAV